MGTSAKLIIRDYRKATIACVYSQSDGYPEDFGKDVVDWLLKHRLTEGIADYDDHSICNGMEDLAAKLVCHLKSSSPVGGNYLVPGPSWDADYTYVIWPKIFEGACANGIYMTVRDSDNRRLFGGLIAAYREFLQSEESK